MVVLRAEPLVVICMTMIHVQVVVKSLGCHFVVKQVVRLTIVVFSHVVKEFEYASIYKFIGDGRPSYIDWM